jgi:hypothetical protein
MTRKLVRHLTMVAAMICLAAFASPAGDASARIASSSAELTPKFLECQVCAWESGSNMHAFSGGTGFLL